VSPRRAGRTITTGAGERRKDRIYGLSPGGYYLAAKEHDQNWRTMVDASASPPAENYVTTYYPGTTDPAAAVPLDVTAGAQLIGISLIMVRARAFRVRGRVEGRPSARISFAPRGAPEWMSINQSRNRPEGDVLAGRRTSRRLYHEGDFLVR